MARKGLHKVTKKVSHMETAGTVEVVSVHIPHDHKQNILKMMIIKIVLLDF